MTSTTATPPENRPYLVFDPNTYGTNDYPIGMACITERNTTGRPITVTTVLWDGSSTTRHCNNT